MWRSCRPRPRRGRRASRPLPARRAAAARAPVGSGRPRPSTDRARPGSTGARTSPVTEVRGRGPKPPRRDRAAARVASISWARRRSRLQGPSRPPSTGSASRRCSPRSSPTARRPPRSWGGRSSLDTPVACASISPSCFHIFQDVSHSTRRVPREEERMAITETTTEVGPLSPRHGDGHCSGYGRAGGESILRGTGT